MSHARDRRFVRAAGAGIGAAVIAAMLAAPLAATGRPQPPAETQRPAPGVGDAAPDFALPGSDGRIHTLAEHRGLRPVVIAWFPRALAKV